MPSQVPLQLQIRHVMPQAIISDITGETDSVTQQFTVGSIGFVLEHCKFLNIPVILMALCHKCAGTPSRSLLKHLLKQEGGQRGENCQVPEYPGDFDGTPPPVYPC